jgi:putative Holliday junction resolvase
MRYLALDVGNKRVGVAVGNSDLRLATPLCIIERTSIERDAGRLRELAREYDAETIVVGLPRHADNTASAQETLTRNYVDALKPFVLLPFVFQDERYSTSAAMQQQRAPRSTRMRRR